jgi:transposase
MAPPQKAPLRPLTPEERLELEQVSRSTSQSAARVARAKSLLAVANGLPFAQAARVAGRLEGDAVTRLVQRFNKDGISVLNTKHSKDKGFKSKYGPEHHAKILEVALTTPDREQDGTAQWSLTTLQRRLRCEPGLETLSTYVIFQTLHEAGLTWQKDRTWCQTGKVLRKRKSGSVVVEDPDATAKKT